MCLKHHTTQLVDFDEYSPMTVNNYDEYEHVSKAFALNEDQDQKGALRYMAI